MKNLFFLAVLFTSITSFAQTSVKDSNSVVIHKDPRIDMLKNKQAQVNEVTSREARKTAKGFRILVMRSNNPDEAIAAKTKVYTYFPELKAYLWHQSPNYNVKVGNFTDRKEAEAYQKKLAAYFPKVFIMNDIVEVKLDNKPWEEDL
jgi:hypothetical protein